MDADESAQITTQKPRKDKPMTTHGAGREGRGKRSNEMSKHARRAVYTRNTLLIKPVLGVLSLKNRALIHRS
jgi:hypothetical protein